MFRAVRVKNKGKVGSGSGRSFQAVNFSRKYSTETPIDKKVLIVGSNNVALTLGLYFFYSIFAVIYIIYSNTI